jgi:DNA-binding MarR family transcriptional regulator
VLFAALNQAAREHSTATVLFHAAMNERRGLSATEGKTLDLLARFGPQTASQLAAHTGLAPASVTELIDRLEAKGFVRRQRDEQDRRRVLVDLVPERLAELADDFERFGRSVDTLWNEFTDAELAVVHRFLTRATAFVQETATHLADGAETGGPRARQP